MAAAIPLGIQLGSDSVESHAAGHCNVLQSFDCVVRHNKKKSNGSSFRGLVSGGSLAMVDAGKASLCHITILLHCVRILDCVSSKMKKSNSGSFRASVCGGYLAILSAREASRQ